MEPYQFFKDILKSPKFVLAPMVDMSELAWRILGRRYGCQLTYTPMINGEVFISDPVYRKKCLQFSEIDRPLIVQFAANSPETFATAAKYVKGFCDAVDLNLGCPQGIAKRGHYGAYLQEEWDLIIKIISYCRSEASIPVTAKIRIFSDVNRSVAYAQALERAGVFMLAVHGRTRDQKGHSTGLASWDQIKAIKRAVSIPVISNGNIRHLNDALACIEETGVDAIMSAEGHLYNPALFAGIQPQVYAICKEYLELARMYSSPISSVRGHVFKLCRDALNVHTEFRPQFADCKDLDDFEDAIRRMEEKCSVCKATDRSPYNLHWTCKAYLRGDILLAEPEINCNLSALDENTSGDTTQHEMESCMLAVKHKRLQEEREKRKIEKRTRMAEKRKHTLRLGAQRHEFCTTCMMNKRSKHCSNSECLICCAQSVNDCEVHKKVNQCLK